MNEMFLLKGLQRQREGHELNTGPSVYSQALMMMMMMIMIQISSANIHTASFMLNPFQISVLSKKDGNEGY